MSLISDDHDPCLFTWHSENKMALLVLYVDDMLIASNDKDKLIEIKTELKQTFEISVHLGEPKEFL